MIRRQRELLKQTFTLRELQNVSDSRIEQLGANQQEILTATQEFSEGLRQRGAEVPPLEQAIVEMQGAVDALRAGLLEVGQAMEESALASLIEARQNLRQILNMSNSSQSSQCRTFDRQQQQKLRPPEQERKSQDQQSQQQLNQACQTLEQLAQQQQQWSQQVNPPSQSSSSSGQSGTPRQQPMDPARQQQLAEQQRSAIRQAEEVSQQLEESRLGGELAEQRMDQAGQDMQEALDELGSNRTEGASDAAQQAAQRLRELAEHLQRLNEPEFSQRLAKAANLAQQLADDQQQLAGSAADQQPQGGSQGEPKEQTGSQGEPNEQDGTDGGSQPQRGATGQSTEQDGSSGQTQGSGRDGESSGERMGAAQRRLAERGEELDELTARLAAESLDQQPEIHRMIQDAREANPTGEIVELMRAAAEDFDADQASRAVQSADVAARSLRQLSDDLRGAHERLTQPDLEQLLEAEQQAAEVLRRMLQSRSEAERQLARSQLDELERTLDPLAGGDQRLAKAMDAMRGRGDVEESADEGTNRSRNASSTFERAGDVQASAEARLDESDRVMVTGLRRVTNVLQTMIQEAVLDRALLDPDDAVPPGYQKMVEEYYRALSEDLR